MNRINLSLLALCFCAFASLPVASITAQDANTTQKNMTTQMPTEQTEIIESEGTDCGTSISNQELLAMIDSLRGYPDKGFSFAITNVSYQGDASPKKNQLKVSVLGQKSLVEFLAPQREKGRAMLKEDDNYWLYIPGTRKIIRITPAQRLIGQTSNGDVVGTNFSLNYDVVNRELIESQDGNPQLKLDLEAKHPRATYSKVSFLLDPKQDLLPVQSEFYSRAGKLLKTAHYKEYSQVGDEAKVHKILLVDPLREKHYTWMLFENYQMEALSDAIFQKDALQRL